MAGAPTDEEEILRSYPWVRLPSVGHPRAVVAGRARHNSY